MRLLAFLTLWGGWLWLLAVGTNWPAVLCAVLAIIAALLLSAGDLLFVALMHWLDD